MNDQESISCALHLRVTCLWLERSRRNRMGFNIRHALHGQLSTKIDFAVAIRCGALSYFHDSVRRGGTRHHFLNPRRAMNRPDYLEAGRAMYRVIEKR